MRICKISIIILFLQILQGLYAVKIEYVTHVTNRIAIWVETYYEIYSHYPENIHDLIESNLKGFEYNHKDIYISYSKEGYAIEYSKQLLILTVVKRYYYRNEKEISYVYAKCVYHIDSKLYELFENDVLIRSYYLN